MILTPNAAAHSPPTLVPPYATSLSSDANAVDFQCGGHAAVQHPMHWSASSGRVTGSELGAAVRSHCSVVGTNTAVDSLGSADSWVDVGFPLHGLTGNGVNLSLAFQWQENSTAGLSGGVACRFAPINLSYVIENQDCDSEIGWSVDISAEIWDQTNGTVVSQDASSWMVGNSSTLENYTDYSYGITTRGTSTYGCIGYQAQTPIEDYVSSCEPNGTRSGTGSLWVNNSYSSGGKTVNDTMLRSHHYELLLEFQLYVRADIGGYGYAYYQPPGMPTLTGHPHAEAAVSLTGHGNGVKVTSVNL